MTDAKKGISAFRVKRHLGSVHTLPWGVLPLIRTIGTTKKFYKALTGQPPAEA
ncbi:MAG: hypothetical protein HY238_16320 [Acidobacteria bacterium]|nr:hypothetical protein [Acidobacteriota bacterium]